MFYKEYLKTRWYLLLLMLTTLGFAGYGLLRMHRVIALHGVGHVWEVMLTRDVIFIDLLEFVPLIGGILLAVVQFAPEMYHKCLKLTLHLPVSHLKVVNQMLLFGVAAWVIIVALNFLLIMGYASSLLATELWSRMVLTALPWYLAGLSGYLLSAWIILEPAWPRRFFNVVVALLVLKVYFISEQPMAYVGFLPLLCVYTFLLLSLSWISICRFKEGKE